MTIPSMPISINLPQPYWQNYFSIIDLWIVCNVYWLAKVELSEYTDSSSYSLDWGVGFW